MKNQILKKIIVIIMILVLNIGIIFGDIVNEHGDSTDEVDLSMHEYIEGMPIYHQYYIFEKAKKSSFSMEFLFAVISLESNFDYTLTHYNKDKNGKVLSYDRGYFQMNNKYEEWYANLAGLIEYNVFDPYDNIKMGIAGLEFWRNQAINAGYTNEKDILRYTLNSYNMGEGGFKKYMQEYNTMDRAYSNIILKRTKEYMNDWR